MNDIEMVGGQREARGGYKVDVTRGQRVGRVSSEWFSRPSSAFDSTATFQPGYGRRRTRWSGYARRRRI
jgi:hypothetical protein